MVAGAEIDAVIDAGDGAAGLIGQAALERHAIDGADARGGAGGCLGADRAGIADRAGEQPGGGAVEHAAHAGALQPDAVAGGGQPGGRLAPAQDRAGIGDGEGIAGVGQLHGEASPLQPRTRINRATIVDDEVLGGAVGIDRAVALIAGAQDGAGIGHHGADAAQVDDAGLAEQEAGGGIVHDAAACALIDLNGLGGADGAQGAGICQGHIIRGEDHHGRIGDFAHHAGGGRNGFAIDLADHGGGVAILDDGLCHG